MVSTMMKFPPFDSLVAFEVVARLGNMTSAARELGLTQSAVSHRIRRLEDYMGLRLFERNGSTLNLTSTGAMLRAEVEELLTRSAQLRERCIAAEAPSVLRIGAYGALADHWLVRRLKRFTDAHPDIVLQVIVIENEAPERFATADVRIGWVPVSEAKSTSTQIVLHREHVFPVGAPSLLADGGGLQSCEALALLPLLHKQSPGQGPEWSWDCWFDRLALGSPARETMRFSSIGPMISAAIEGSGLALARSMLVRDALQDGRLVRVLPPELSMLSTKVHVLRWPTWRIGDRRVRAFTEWFSKQATESSLN
jgi:LysR family transcriptional regulator, glycine cleavage system transcriptional activator